MATVNVNRATNTLGSPTFLKSAVLIVVGSLLAQVVTSWMRTNVRDINVKGGDAVYSVVATLLTPTVLPAQYSRPIALGSTAVRVVANVFGIVYKGSKWLLRAIIASGATIEITGWL